MLRSFSRTGRQHLLCSVCHRDVCAMYIYSRTSSTECRGKHVLVTRSMRMTDDVDECSALSPSLSSSSSYPSASLIYTIIIPIELDINTEAVVFD